MITSLGIKVSLLHYSLQVLSIMTRPICFITGTVNMVCDRDNLTKHIFLLTRKGVDLVRSVCQSPKITLRSIYTFESVSSVVSAVRPLTQSSLQALLW